MLLKMCQNYNHNKKNNKKIFSNNYNKYNYHSKKEINNKI